MRTDRAGTKNKAENNIGKKIAQRFCNNIIYKRYLLPIQLSKKNQRSKFYTGIPTFNVGT